jgi:catalase
MTENIAGPLGKCRKDIQEKMLRHFVKIDPDYGGRIAKILGLPVPMEHAKL